VKAPLFLSPGTVVAPQLELERLYERIQLIAGKGTRRRGQLCIMSFVALLAGERHGDQPRTASPLIRQFAIVLNDGMPDSQRQRLKPFAPRIIGTNDGFDEARAKLLRGVLRDEIGPRLRRDLIDGLSQTRLCRELFGAGQGLTQVAHCLWGGSASVVLGDGGQNSPQRLGREVARLLVRCARDDAPAESRAWYWAKGMDLLDRLCDIGSSGSYCALAVDQLAWAESALDGNRRLDQISHLIASAWQRLT
jgi:hypothetical protein